MNVAQSVKKKKNKLTNKRIRFTTNRKGNSHDGFGYKFKTRFNPSYSNGNQLDFDWGFVNGLSFNSRPNLKGAGGETNGSGTESEPLDFFNFLKIASQSSMLQSILTFDPGGMEGLEGKALLMEGKLSYLFWNR